MCGGTAMANETIMFLTVGLLFKGELRETCWILEEWSAA